MGTPRNVSPFPPQELDNASDDDESFFIGDIDSSSEFSDGSSTDYDSENIAPQLPVEENKDPRSKAKYNIFSRLFFLWLEPLFWLGCQRELYFSDLYTHPSEADSEKLLKRFNRHWASELERKRRGGKARLMVALTKCFWWRLLVQGFSILIETAILVCQSIVLGLLTDYFSIDEPTSENTRSAYLNALGLVLMTVLVIVMHSHSFLMGQKMSMISRIITTGAIYKKILSLSQVDIAQVSVGHIINLASNDVQRFDPAFPHLPYLWVAPLHLVAFTYLVYQQFGWSVFLASGFLLLQIPMQIGMAKLFVILRFKSAKLTDRRVRIMNEIISGIRVIKMYAWENAFKKVISKLRKNESFVIFQGAIIRACTLANMIVSISIIMWLMMTSFVGSGGEPTTRQVFTTLSLLTSLRLSTYFFVLAILGYSEGQVAVSRIQTLLELETSGSPNKSMEDFSYIQLESQDSPDTSLSFANPLVEETVINNDSSVLTRGETGNASSTNDDTVSVSMESLSASWNYRSDKNVLHNITFEVNQEMPLLAIVGSVGSGKSTLLQCLLGELKPMTGKVEVKGRLSYVSQEPWMFMGTIRDNILFGMPYDSAWYNRVIEACSLDEDFNQLPFGDLTLVGERGVTLSGGQKARVNLARAVYHDADIFLLDDPLSAVDVAVASHLFNNCIRGLLSGHLVILATHQLQFALQADRILVIKEGCQEVYGSYKELVSRGIDPNFLLGMIKDDKDSKEDDNCTTSDFYSSGSNLQNYNDNMPTNPALHLSSSMYKKTPFEMMHELKSASSDDPETDEDTSFPPPRFLIRTETPRSGVPPHSPFHYSSMNHVRDGEVGSSESDVEATHSSPDVPSSPLPQGSDVDHDDNQSPDFPKFRPGLLFQLNQDGKSTSPDFPKFRPGLLSPQNIDGKSTSPDFPKFRPGLLSQQTKDEKSTSLDFPKFRPGLLAECNSNTNRVASMTNVELTKATPNLQSHQTERNGQTSPDLRSGLASHQTPSNNNISPDFPKFRPNLLSGQSPSSPPFRLASPPLGRSRSHLRSSGFSQTSDYYTNSTTPSSQTGFVTPRLKCPVSPLARTSSAQSRFPHIRSILKSSTGGPLVSSHLGRTTVSPLRKKVLQHNADLSLMRKETRYLNDHPEETDEGWQRATDNSNVTNTKSTDDLPLLMLTSATPPLNHAHSTRQGMSSISPQLNPVIECAEPDNTQEPDDIAAVYWTSSATPSSSDETDQETNAVSSTPLHVHFAADSGRHKLHSVPSTGHLNQVSHDPNASYKKNDTSFPSISFLPPTPPTRLVGDSSVVSVPSPLLNFHQENQMGTSTISTSPLSHANIPKKYSRRKSVTFERESILRTSPSGYPNFRKGPLSPTSSRYYKRRRSIATIGHKQRTEHHKVLPNPQLPSHIYRKVSLSPTYRYSVQHKKQSQHDHIQIPIPHIPFRDPETFVKRKRRKSVSVVTYHEGANNYSINNPRHRKRRKSVLVLSRTEEEHYPGEPRHQKRRKSVSISTEHEGEHYPGSLRYQKRRQSVSVLRHPEGEYYPDSLRHQKRRKSVSILAEHDKDCCITSPKTSRYHKRRKSVSVSTECEDGQHNSSLDRDHVNPSSSMSTSTHHKDASVHPVESRHHNRRQSDSVLTQHEIDGGFHKLLNSRYYRRRKSESVVGQYHNHHLRVPSPHLPVHVHRDVSLSAMQSDRHHMHRSSLSKSENDLLPKSQSPNLIPPRSNPMSPINYKRQTSVATAKGGHNLKTSGGDHRSSTQHLLRSPGHFLRRHFRSQFSFKQRNRRKSVLVINRENRLIPVTSPLVNRVSLSPYQRSLPTTPLPRRYARRKSLSSVITPRPRRRFGEDEQFQVTMEAARFDVTSIYSAKSFLSLAPHTIVRDDPVITSPLEQETFSDDEALPALAEEEKGEGNISMKLYYNYFRAGGNILLLLAIIAIFVVGEAGIVVSDWFLSDWADCSSLQESFTNSTLRSTCLLSPSQRIGIYTITSLVAVVVNFARAILFYFICLRASYVLHNRMFSSILKTFVQFFDNNPAGRILNRFSKDIGFLDDLLPFIFCEYLLLLLRCVAVIATAVASNPWVVIPAIILVIAFLILRWYYLRTSREVKRLEAVARSPVYSHIAITLHGLPMIRSLGQQHVMLDQFHTYQNQHSQGWYLYLVTVRWFGLRIDLLSSFFLIAVAFFSVPLASQLNAGLVGLGLTYVISLADMLQYTIRLSADVENTMVSAERIIGYGSLEEEANLDTHLSNEKPPSNWPDKGMITFENVSFRYSSELPLVLKDLSFTIQPAEKVGVVGRTGAGKSSLISVLYRLAEPHGLITIDGIDSKAIGLHDLRKKMSIIPQDPVLFSGTMRYNLDPFDEYTDAELWAALEQVQLKSAVQQLEGQLGGEVSEGGSNFSVGQRQLVCLARALLRKNKILVLDEATANVDQRTDEVIQMTIREKFSDCTVIAIAHRLNTIMDADKIMLLKKGRLVEFDSPYNLLQNSASKFHKMVEKTGPASAERLHQIALKAHLGRTFGSKSTRVPLSTATSSNGGSRIPALVARSLLQRDTSSTLSRIEERRPSIISSSSYPCALNEIGTNTGMNANDPNLQNLRLPSDPNVSISHRSMYEQEDVENEGVIAGEDGSNDVPYNA